MNENELDRLLDSAKARSLPRCPTTLDAKVLRRVRLARDAEAQRFGLDWLLALFDQTKFAAAALVAILLLSSTASVIATATYEQKAERRSMASTALDFGIFHEAKIVRLDP